MLRKLLRFKTLERVVLAMAFISFGSYWFMSEPPNASGYLAPTLKPTIMSGDEEKVVIITAAPKKHEPDQENIKLKEIHPPKVRKKLLSSYHNSPLNSIEKLTITDGKVDDITIVTAYINLGRYSGKGNIQYSPDLYREWMKIFGKIKNPVIAFMNDKNDISLFSKIRQGIPAAKSKVELVTKQLLWGFDFTPNIKKILGRKEYKNVTKPAGYLSVLHSKYDFMATALKYNYFNTKYYCWIDMDLFKDILKTVKSPFSLYVPSDFREDRIAYSEESPRHNSSIAAIFLENKSWVSGSAFLGRASLLKAMVLQYAKYTEMYINRTYINTDAQVLYAMYQNSRKLAVSIQAYPVSNKYKHGEQLGYLMIEAGAKRKKH